MIAVIDRLWARFRAVFTKRTLDADFDAELAHHLDLQTAENIKAGLAPNEARRQANIALGGVEQARELHRATRGLPSLEQFVSDLRHTIRNLRRERGFAGLALLILAVGVGLNTTVFSLVNTVLLRPVPFAHGDRLVWIFNGDPASPSRDLSNIASTIDTWEGLRETTRTLEQVEAYNPFSVRQTYRLVGDGEPETILAVDVSHGLFEMLGVHPMLGRRFLPEDAVSGAPFRVILSHQLWQRRFGANPRIVGQTVRIDHESVEVIGVLPPADPFTSVFFPAVRVDLFGAIRNNDIRTWGNTVTLIGRAKPDIAIESVAADLELSVAQLKKQYPERSSFFRANAMPLQEWISGSLKQPLLFLWIAAGLVLAIVSFNLGGLLLARGASRRKEFALRCALGASRWRIASQLLTECLVLVMTGSLLGGLLAWAFVRFLAVRSAVEIPLLQSLRLDAGSLGFTVLLGLITVALCGALPAWRLAHGVNLETSLRDEGRGSSGGRQRTRLRSALVVAEVALACVLAMSAGLMVRSFFNLLKVDLGFASDNLIAVRIDPAIDGSHASYLDGILERVRALPGVEHAAMTDCLPVERDRSWGLYPVIQDQPSDQRWTGAHVRVVSPGLFETMGTRIVAGRDFEPTDTSERPPVIVINQTLAHRFWPGQEAVGRQVNNGRATPWTVIGVVADVRHAGPEAPAGNEMYFSYHAQGSASWDMLVRTKLPVAALTADLRRALREVDATLPLTKVRPLQVLIDRTLSSRRLLVWLIGGFAGIAIGLAALGLYGVISYMVTQQAKEIGIRMALGADASMVQREIVGRTLSLAVLGVVVGLSVAFIAGRGLESLLYGVSAHDVTTTFVTTIALLGCALFAGYLPARRASRVDPLIALRID